MGWRLLGFVMTCACTTPALEVAAPADAAPQPSASVPATPELRNVVLFVVDTLRADHLGTYGAEVPTPALDALAQRSTVFERAYATASWTKPAVGSLLTGLYPWHHGAITHLAPLDPEAPLLAERLQAAGLETRALSANGYVSRRFGFDRGFEVFEQPGARRGVASEMTRDALRWLDSRDGERGVFLYLHTTDVHAPYRPRASTVERIRRTRGEAPLAPLDLRDAMLIRRFNAGHRELDAEERRTLRRHYEAGVIDHDEALGALVAGLETRGYLEDTLVVFVSDHGEHLFEDGRLGHGGDSLHEVLVHIPLVVYWPGRSARRELRPVSQIDVPRTILDALGIDEPFGEDEARSLRTPLAERWVAFGKPGRALGVSDGRDVLLEGGEPGILEGDRLRTAERILAAAHLPRPRRERALDQELTDQLRALGYVGDE